jgi:hypothetical protein
MKKQPCKAQETETASELSTRLGREIKAIARNCAKAQIAHARIAPKTPWLILQDRAWKQSLKEPVFNDGVLKNESWGIIAHTLRSPRPCLASGWWHDARKRAAIYARDIAAKSAAENSLLALAEKMEAATGDELIDIAVAIGEQAALARILAADVSNRALTGEKRLHAARGGAVKTRSDAENRKTEICRVYRNLKNENAGVKRCWLLDRTVEHFQGTRTKTRKFYGKRTVEAATKGL